MAWYIIKKGVMQGPHTVDEIKAKITQKELGPFDRATISSVVGAWMSLSRCQPFEKEFSEEELSINEKLWVVLKKKKTGKGFVQRKPLTEDEVREAIKTGEVAYSDFIWRSGMCEWYRVSFLSEFCKADVLGTVDFPDVPSVNFPVTSSEAAVASSDLMAEVVEQPKKKSEKKSAIDTAPAESDGKNLAENFSDSDEIRELKKEWASLQVDRRQSADRRSVARRVFGRDRRGQGKLTIREVLLILYKSMKSSFRNPKIVPFAGVIFIGAVLGVYLTFSTYSDFQHWNLSEKIARVKQRIAPTTQVKAVKKSSKKTKKKRKIVEKKRAPTFFNFKFSKLSSSKAQIKFSTDASAHYPVKIKIYGQAGDVLKKWSVYLTKKVWFESKKKKSLRLLGLGLSDGRYRISASIEGFERGKTFFLGKPGRSFKNAMRKHKKKMSFWFQGERRALIDQTTKWLAWLEKREGKGSGPGDLKKWRRQWKKLEASQMKVVRSKRLKHFVLPMEWVDLEKINSDFKKRLKKASKLGPAAKLALIKKIKRRIKKERGELLSLSLWK